MHKLTPLESAAIDMALALAIAAAWCFGFNNAGLTCLALVAASSMFVGLSTAVIEYEEGRRAFSIPLSILISLSTLSAMGCFIAAVVYQHTHQMTPIWNGAVFGWGIFGLGSNLVLFIKANIQEAT